MRIATWNINGVKARIETAPRWLAEDGPDIVCLQEIKSVDEAARTAVLALTGTCAGKRIFGRATATVQLG